MMPCEYSGRVVVPLLFFVLMLLQFPINLARKSSGSLLRFTDGCLRAPAVKQTSSALFVGALSPARKWHTARLIATSRLLKTQPQHTAPTRRDFSLPVAKQWYYDPDLERDRSHVLGDELEHATSKYAKYILIEGGNGMYHNVVDHTVSSKTSSVEPLFLSYDEIAATLGQSIVPDMISEPTNKSVLAWVGKREDADYWVLYLAVDDASSQVEEMKIQPKLTDIIRFRRQTTSDEKEDDSVLTMYAKSSPLREFGDRLASFADAGILATANGLVEFHKSHPFCSHCGSPTIPVKAGSSRRCTKSECGATSYPRIDTASIMLITSPCEDYALLGRKAAWPKGRYSTLAGFTEVGETLENCCVRETFEESGVQVDPASVRFVCSQPWPFPRSLMVGFRARALPNDQDELPPIVPDIEEMEDVRWFHREFVAARLKGGSTALSYDPTEQEQEFHIPGRSSLARILITQWATEK